MGWVTVNNACFTSGGIQTVLDNETAKMKLEAAAIGNLLSLDECHAGGQYLEISQVSASLLQHDSTNATYSVWVRVRPIGGESLSTSSSPLPLNCFANSDITLYQKDKDSYVSDLLTFDGIQNGQRLIFEYRQGSEPHGHGSIPHATVLKKHLPKVGDLVYIHD